MTSNPPWIQAVNTALATDTIAGFDRLSLLTKLPGVRSIDVHKETYFIRFTIELLTRKRIIWHVPLEYFDNPSKHNQTLINTGFKLAIETLCKVNPALHHMLL